MPSDLRASVEPAYRLLVEPLGPERKAFLRAFSFEGERGHAKLVVETNREQDAGEAGRRVIEELRRRFSGQR